MQFLPRPVEDVHIVRKKPFGSALAGRKIEFFWFITFVCRKMVNPSLDNILCLMSTYPAVIPIRYEQGTIGGDRNIIGPEPIVLAGDHIFYPCAIACPGLVHDVGPD